MKKLLLIALLLSGGIVYSQIYVPAVPTVYGSNNMRLKADSTLLYPTGCGVPTSLHSSEQKMAALYYDSCNHKLWVYDPKLLAWDSIHVGFGGAGGGGGGAGIIGTINSQPKSPNGAVVFGDSLIMQTADAIYPGLVTAYDKRRIDSNKYIIGDSTYNAVGKKTNDSTFWIKSLRIKNNGVVIVPDSTDRTIDYNIETASGGDSSIFDNVIDTTGQPSQRVLFSVPPNHIGSSQYFLYDSLNKKLLIGTNNAALGGGTTRLYVAGNIISNSLTQTNALTVTGMIATTDTTTYKPIGIASGGTTRKFASWGELFGGAPTLQRVFNNEVGGSVLTKFDSIQAGAFGIRLYGTGTNPPFQVTSAGGNFGASFLATGDGGEGIRITNSTGGSGGSSGNNVGMTINTLRTTSGTNTALVADATNGTNNYAITAPHGQVVFGSTAPSNNSVLLDLVSTTRGFKPPTLNTTQMNAVSSPLSGLMVYNSDSTAYCYYNGSVWLKIGAGASTPTTPGFDDVLAVGQNLTTTRTVGMGSNNLTFSAGTATVNFSGSIVPITTTASTGGSSLNSISPSLIVSHSVSGTPANGIGSGIRFGLQDLSSIVSVDIGMKLTDVTHATRTTQFDIGGLNSASSETFMNIQHDLVRINNNTDTLSTKAYARSLVSGLSNGNLSYNSTTHAVDISGGGTSAVIPLSASGVVGLVKPGTNVSVLSDGTFNMNMSSMINSTGTTYNTSKLNFIAGTGITLGIASGSVGGSGTADITISSSGGTGTVSNIGTISPLSGGPITTSGNISIANADADGSTKGAASFTANDFNASSGNISIDYTNAQKASSTVPGFATSNQVTTSIGARADGMGNTVTLGSMGFITIPYDCTITQWYVTADVSGSIVFDIKRSGTSIIGGGNAPTLTAAQSNTAAPSGWTSTTITANDVLEYSISSATTVSKVTLVLKVVK